MDNYYTKDEVDSKIIDSGGGNVYSNSTLNTDNLIVGAGEKSIKDSGVPLTALVTEEQLVKPTEFN